MVEHNAKRVNLKWLTATAILRWETRQRRRVHFAKHSFAISDVLGLNAQTVT
jgi:hypothetical protein